MEKQTLHITNGNNLTDYLQELDVKGEILTWEEMLCEGPLVETIDSELFLNTRKEFLNNTYDIEIDESEFRKQNQLSEKPIIAILPGSRKQEIKKMLSVMLSVVKNYAEYQFVIAGAPSQDREFYNQFIKNENVTPSGIPALRKLKNMGIDEHEQKGVIAPNKEAIKCPDPFFFPVSHFLTFSAGM